jgi:hypothetical protein
MLVICMAVGSYLLVVTPVCFSELSLVCQLSRVRSKRDHTLIPYAVFAVLRIVYLILSIFLIFSIIHVGYIGLTLR